MSERPTTVLVVGATGSIGRLVVEEARPSTTAACATCWRPSAAERCASR
jgi:uncharacterized protein YbjT (DUF2867 family)